MSDLVVEAATTLPDHEPKRTIGWDVIRWCESLMQSPMGDGTPLRFTIEQGRFIAWWFAVDADGRWLYRRGVLRRAKGWGKDPLGAILALVEMVGPCRVAGWDSAGEPVGGPVSQPYVGVAAVSEDQTRNTTSMLDVVASTDLVARHRLKLGVSGLSRGRTTGGARAELRPMTTSWRASEGKRLTAVILGESQHLRAANGGHEMAAVLNRNLAKAPDGSARMLTITNAHEPGEDSVAERDEEAWQAQQAAGGGDILLDTRYAVVDDRFNVRDEAQMIPALAAAYGDSVWVDLGRFAADAADPATPPAHIMRFNLNRITAGAAKWMDPQAWDAASSLGPICDAGDAISVGFDGSRTRDATGIVCTSMQTGLQWAAAVWERDWRLHPDGDDGWEVPEGEVVEAVERIFATWPVARMYADPAWWQETVARWCGRWEQAAAWQMGGGRVVATARAVTAYRGAVSRCEARWGGPNGDVFRRHVLNAVERPLQAHQQGEENLHTVAKASRRSRGCIDLAVAAVLSWQARLDALAAGWKPEVKFRSHSSLAARREQRRLAGDVTLGVNTEAADRSDPPR